MPDPIPQLRKKIAVLEARGAALEDGTVLPLGLPGLDRALGGGLCRGALHEVAPAAPFHLAAALGFSLATAVAAAKASRWTIPIMWIQQEFAGYEAGDLYGPGLQRYGLALPNLIVARLPRAIDALWAMEEALKALRHGVVIAELAETGAAADLTVTRRLALAARPQGLGLLVRHKATDAPCAAATRFEIAASPGRGDRFGGMGRTAFTLSLRKNRHGPCGRWTIEWDHHERSFAEAVSRVMAETAFDRPARAAHA